MGADMQAVNSVLSELNLVNLSGSLGTMASYESLVALGAGVGSTAGIAKKAIQDKIEGLVAKRVAERSPPEVAMEAEQSVDLDVVRENHYGPRRAAIEPEQSNVLPAMGQDYSK